MSLVPETTRWQLSFFFVVTQDWIKSSLYWNYSTWLNQVDGDRPVGTIRRQLTAVLAFRTTTKKILQVTRSLGTRQQLFPSGEECWKMSQLVVVIVDRSKNTEAVLQNKGRMKVIIRPTNQVCQIRIMEKHTG
jgi:hypothetical protein